MAPDSAHATKARIWALAKQGVVDREQLRGLGLGHEQIRHLRRNGFLHERWPGVYAVGRPELGRHGTWLAAVKTCGEGALLSHGSAAALWKLLSREPRGLELSVPYPRQVRRAGIRIHRPRHLSGTIRFGIPVTRPAETIITLAAQLPAVELERCVNAADKLGLVDPERLRSALDGHPRQPGTRALVGLLDDPTFTLTDSELERRFIPLAIEAGLACPLTQQVVNGYRVDFYWPDLNLVVETDGLTYHRTAQQQSRDLRRDHAHAAAGTERLRFSRYQVAKRSPQVVELLRRVERRLRAAV